MKIVLLKGDKAWVFGIEIPTLRKVINENPLVVVVVIVVSATIVIFDPAGSIVNGSLRIRHISDSLVGARISRYACEPRINQFIRDLGRLNIKDILAIRDLHRWTGINQQYLCAWRITDDTRSRGN